MTPFLKEMGEIPIAGNALKKYEVVSRTYCRNDK